MRTFGELRRRSVLQAAAMFVAILVVAGAAGLRADPPELHSLVGAAAPDFVVTGADGAEIRLQDSRGHPMWLTFFSSWCAYCRAENPDIEAVALEQRQTGTDLVVLGVGVGETRTSATDYARAAGLTFAIAADTEQSVARRYAVLALPTHVFIDRDGVIREIRVGTLRPEVMRALVAELVPPSAQR